MPETRPRGFFITLEGGEGSGKTTLAAALACALEERRHNVCLTREPGGTQLGRAIEQLFEQKEADDTPAPVAELLLFEADRAQHVSENIIPALAAGDIVVCDRFTDSSLAYQGFGRDLGLDFVRTLNKAATGGLKPDLTLLLDVPPEVGLARAPTQTDATGRESIDFHARVREGFLQLAREEPGRFVVIDSTLPLDEVTEMALAVVARLLELSA
jgi:dTMP kinase